MSTAHVLEGFYQQEKMIQTTKRANKSPLSSPSSPVEHYLVNVKRPASAPHSLHMQDDSETTGPIQTLTSNKTCQDVLSPSVQFKDVKQLIKHYSCFESFYRCQDGRKLLWKNLTEARKEEQIRFLECVEEFGFSPCSEEATKSFCKRLYQEFLLDNSKYQLNVTNKYKKEYETLTEKKESMLKHLEWFNKLYNEILIQINTETFGMMKKTEEFQVWLLTKALEWLTQNQKSESMPISEFLAINDLSEYEKMFKKKKLTEMSHIKHMTDQAEFKQLGVTKLGHQKKLARLVRQFFTE